MVDTILIRAGSERCDSWEWAMPGRAPAAMARTGAVAVSELAALCRGYRVVLIVPGADVHLCAVNVPARSMAEIRMAVPYALEERVADRIESLHFAVGARAADGMIPVAVVAAARMQAWIDALARAGVTAGSVVPEPLALPWAPDSASVLIEAGRWVVRTGPHAGFAVDGELAPAVVRERVLNGSPSSVRLWNMDGAQPPNSPAALPGDEDHRVSPQTLPASVMALYARGVQETPPGFDLLQGAYRRADRTFAPRRWWPSMALLGAALFTHVSWSIWDYRHIEAQAQSLRQQNMASFSRVFPGVRRIVDPRVQGEQELARLRAGRHGDSDFLALFLVTAPSLRAAAGTVINGLSFGGGALEVRLHSAGVQTLESLQRQLGAARLTAEILSAESRGDGVDGHLRIRANRS